jgi:hypothetical protein
MEEEKLALDKMIEMENLLKESDQEAWEAYLKKPIIGKHTILDLSDFQGECEKARRRLNLKGALIHPVGRKLNVIILEIERAITDLVRELSSNSDTDN